MEIANLEPVEELRRRCQVHDTGGPALFSGRLEARQQQMRQQKMTQVVDSQVRLETVLRLDSVHEHDSS